MSPHVEKLVFITRHSDSNISDEHTWEKVPRTEHGTNDMDSINAKFAHELVKIGGGKYREVKDKRGKVCATIK